MLASPVSLAANLLLVDPWGLGGIHCKARFSAWRQGFLAQLRSVAASLGAVIDLPAQIDERSLIGGLDWAASLNQGEARFDSGLLWRANRGFLQIAMAERLSPQLAGLIAQAFDQRGIDQVFDQYPRYSDLQFGMILIDESLADEPEAPQVLRSRLAFSISDEALRDQAVTLLSARQIAKARALIVSGRDFTNRALPRQGLSAAISARVDSGMDAGVLVALTEAALSFGIKDLRAPQFALRAYRALEALAGVLVFSRQQQAFDTQQSDEALSRIMALIYAPRATTLPQSLSAAQAQDRPQVTSPITEGSAEGQQDQCLNEDHGALRPVDAPADRPSIPDSDQAAGDDAARLERLLSMTVESAQALLPPGLLAAGALAAAARLRAKDPISGRSGSWSEAGLRGQSLGNRVGRPGSKSRLHLLATIRAAVPWQRLREKPSADALLRIEASDLRVHRYAHCQQMTSLFVVDASGSAALHRLAEVKGAVELLLADCYVRRDQVLVIAFRQERAQLLLAPTRSLTRAKRQLGTLAGGGGTPLAHALALCARCIANWRRQGLTIQAIVLSDGKANIDLEGRPGRARATEDALQEARRLARCSGQGLKMIWVDTAPRPAAEARTMAQAMAARYMTLPFANAKGLFALAS